MKKESLINPTKKVVMLGITSWNDIAGREILLNRNVNYFIEITSCIFKQLNVIFLAFETTNS